MLLVGISFSCLDRGKSALVQRLESIFYARDFAKVPNAVFQVSDYGAVGDGATINTLAIQKAIDEASAEGGGVLTFKPGIYLSGALYVKSNVELHLDEGVTIKAIQNEEAYPDIWTRVAGIEMYWPSALINVYQQKNVRITGTGTIDGNGKFWWDKFWGDPPRSGGMWTDYNARGIRWAVDYDCKRVRAVVVYESEDVLLEDFTVERSGFWTVTMTYCKRVYVNRIVIRNNIGGFGPSSDGINTDSSSDILVENCDIDCNDDNLCIKAGRDSDGLRVNRPAENIVYRHSVTRAGHGLITLGSETSGGIRNVEVYGLEAEGTNTGIRFKSARVRGGLMENIWFHDIRMNRVASPFHFELDWYPSYSYPIIPEDFPLDSVPAHWEIMTTPVSPPLKGIPEFRNVRISRVTATQAKTAIHVNAFQEKPMTDLVWNDVQLEALEPGFIKHARNWTMDKVTLKVPGSAKIEMTNCVDVDYPEYISSTPEDKREALSVSKGTSPDFSILLHRLGSGQSDEKITTFSGQHGIIGKGDSLESDTLRLIIIPGEECEFTFFEPLGDGFYYTPVTITSRDEGSLLSISGERVHQWIIYRKTRKVPAEVIGADHWQYHPKGMWLEASIRGSSLKISIR